MKQAADFERDGYVDPVQVFSAQECAKIMRNLQSETVKPLVSAKGWAPSSPTYAEAGSDPRLLDAIRPLLGNDIVLWGASVVVRKDNAVHAFHTDIETSGVDGGFVTVWLGLENTTRDSGLKVIPRSHRYGVTVQESNQRRGILRALSSDETTLAGARACDPGAEIVQPEVQNGTALIFDGRLWHGSHNVTTSVRVAMLLQYARADVPVFLPKTFEWPFTMSEVRPPVLAVSGKPMMNVNRVVPAPERSMSQLP